MASLRIHHDNSLGRNSFRANIESVEGNSFDLAPPDELALSEGEWGNLHSELTWYLEEFPHQSDATWKMRATRVEEALHRWGHGVFESILKSNPKIDAHSLTEICIETRDPKVATWPWEAIVLPHRGQAGLSLEVKRIHGSITDAPVSIKTDALRILLVSCRPLKDDLDLRVVSRPLVECIQGSGLPASIHILRPPTFENLLAHLQNSKGYQMLHFDCHGVLGSDQHPALVFENQTGGPQVVRAERLANDLKSSKIPIAVLNACRSSAPTDSPDLAFASIAESLIAAGLQSVLAMSHNLTPLGAQSFMEGFYSDFLVSGNPSLACLSGRKRMESTCIDHKSWLLPQLFQISENVSLSLSLSAASLSKQTKFSQRDTEILKLERWLNGPEPTFVLHGLSGSGKMALAEEFVEWVESTGLQPSPIMITKSFSNLSTEGKTLLITNSIGSYRDFPGLHIFSEKIADCHVDLSVIKDAAALQLFRLFRKNSRDSDLEVISAQCGLEWSRVESLRDQFLEIGLLSRPCADFLSVHPSLEAALQNLTSIPTRASAEAFVQQIRCVANDIAELPRVERDYLATAYSDNFLMARRLAVDFHEEPKNVAAAIFNGLGHWYFDNEDFSRAIEEFEKLQSCRQSAQDPDGEISALIMIGRSRTNQRKLIEARLILSEAFSLAKKHNLRSQISDSASALGYVSELERDFESAKDFYQQSAEIDELLEDHLGVAMTRHQLGMVAQELGEFDHALRLYEEVFEFAKSAEERDLQARAMHHIGMVFQFQGSFTVAREWFLRSMNIHREAGRESDVASTYHQIAVIEEELGKVENAERWHLQSLEIRERQQDFYHASQTHHQLGILARERGDRSQARAWFKRSLETKLSLGDMEGAAMSWFSLGGTDLDDERYCDAEQWFRKALAGYKRFDDCKPKAETLCQLGLALSWQDRHAEAIEQFEESIELYDKVGDSFHAARTRMLLAQALGLINRRFDALNHLNMSKVIFEEMGASSNLETVNEIFEKLPPE